MSIPSFDKHDRVRLGNESGTNDDGTPRQPFADIAGTATDPTAVTLVVLKPDGSMLAYGWPAAGLDGTLIREGVGRFYVDVTLDQDGGWQWKLTGTGAVETSETGSLHVRWSAFL